MFFAAVMIMFAAGMAEKYLSMDKTLTIVGVALGFILFVISIAL